jgi:hypothetical protein
MTRDTVMGETPACRATSLFVGALLRRRGLRVVFLLAMNSILFSDAA